MTGDDGIKVDPDRPWGDKPLGGLVSWVEMKERYERWMTENAIGNYEIDELALLFGDRDHKWEFIRDCVRVEGVELFNVVNDLVTAYPFGVEYTVEYAFVRVPDLGMRLEIMDIDEGFSPLHMALMFREEGLLAQHYPIGVHLSFKVPTADEYDEVVDALEGSNADLLQECTSDYGMFSYWKPQPGFGCYLKPRCAEPIEIEIDGDVDFVPIPLRGVDNEAG